MGACRISFPLLLVIHGPEEPPKSRAGLMAEKMAYILRVLLQPCDSFMATLLSSLGIVFLVTVVLFFAYSHIQGKRRNPAGLPYPPGPKGYPIIGNLFDIPNAFIYKRFREMSRELSEGPSSRGSTSRSDE